MAPLHSLTLFSLISTVFCQADDARFTVLSPGQDEVVPTDSTYTIKWSGEMGASLGTCTITLLIGQQSLPLSRLWEIAYGIDLASGSFDWPVGFPTSSTKLGRVYGLNFTVDNQEEIYFTSSLFHVGSSDDTEGDDNDNTEGDTNQNDQTNVSTTASSSTISSITSTTGTHSSQTNRSLSPITSVSSTKPPKDEPSSTNTASTQQETGNRQGFSLSTGVTAGIVTAVVLYVVGLVAFIVLICYYKARVLEKMKLLVSGRKHKSEIDGRYRKAELDCQGHEVKITRIYELDATREIQEADGRERPAELDSHNHDDARPESQVVNVEDEKACTRLIEMYEEAGH
ncbi:hypothetical protein F5Y08DRAFT_349467 [Xylaria arbuscula]|nr:hypothetical protein F5Y08DRAFT_349467 [Xylaria arbuscula]